MCLIFPQKLNQTKDVVCYKIFYKHADNNLFYKIINKLFYGKTLLSVFRLTVYKLGKLKKLNVNEPRIFSCIFYYGNKIEGDSLHSFVTINDAFNYLKNDYKQYSDKYIPCIVQCKIPKNSKFLYKGIFEGILDTYQSYASERLIPEEIIAEFIKNDD